MTLTQPALGLFLRDLRGKGNMTQAALSERSGIVKVHISKIENGKVLPNLKTLDKWLQACHHELCIREINETS